MMGRTHYKLGAMFYIILSVMPALAIIPFISNRGTITGLGVIAACIGALIPDADTSKSKINYINPATGLTNRAMDLISLILRVILKFLFTVGPGVIVIIYSSQIVNSITKVGAAEGTAKLITYGFAAIMFLLALANQKVLLATPGLGIVFSITSNLITKFINRIKALIVLIIYLSAGIATIIFTYANKGEVMLYVAGALLILIGIFPHRTFLHSVEGIAIVTAVFAYVVNRFGYGYLLWPFLIGYFSHLYLADIFTDSGVPLSVIPSILEKFKLHESWMQYRAYSAIFNVLKLKLSIPLMKTGTVFGNVLEGIYLFILLAIIIFGIKKVGLPELRLI